MTVEESKYFTKKELMCPCGCGICMMDRHFMMDLDIMRETFNKPIKVVKGYVCHDYNKSISESCGNRPHTTGMAVDIRISGKEADRLFDLILEMETFYGVGLHQSGKCRVPLIHIDGIVGESRLAFWKF